VGGVPGVHPVMWRVRGHCGGFPYGGICDELVKGEGLNCVNFIQGVMGREWYHSFHGFSVLRWEGAGSIISVVPRLC